LDWVDKSCSLLVIARPTRYQAILAQPTGTVSQPFSATFCSS
jgi:hypothetical protein